MSGWLLLLLLAVIGSAYFAASEIAVVSSDRLRHRADRERGSRLAGLAERLYRRPEHTLTALLLGNNSVNILASICALMLTQSGLAALGFRLPAIWSDLLSSLWVSCLILIFGEVLAKGIGHSYALRLTRMTAPLLLVLILLLRPLFWIADIIAWPFRRRRGEESSQVSWETIRLHLETGRAEGILAAEEEVLIRRIALLNRLTAETLMTPVADLTLFPESGTTGEMRQLMLERGAQHCFIHNPSPNRIVGLVKARRLLSGGSESRPTELALPVRQVPAHRPLLDLIDELQLTHSKLAVVCNLGGDACGVVFLDELLRQLVLFQKPGENGLDSPDSEDKTAL